MTESVRLVIWDLDETYWSGTLVEGGITYSHRNHDTVVALARRGIMSSICSKNDLQKVKSLLQEKGIWDFFIFPSINWEPKGARIKSIVDAVQLRPETVLFVDDNPQNLNEARFFLPALQIADAVVLSSILDDVRFAGKHDEQLSRLQQYKLLERRQEDQAAAEGSNDEFLRSCDIRISIENDVEKHEERAIELVNRTNQLNFTKVRLPDDFEGARAALRQTLATFNLQAGLIRVVDRYGDYGYCGFFAVLRTGSGARLVHYCFSCRILGMGVEQFVYQRLNRPSLDIKGEVLTDPADASRQVDWITLVDDASTTRHSATRTTASRSFFLRGGCDLMILEHYFRMVSDDVQAEYSFNRNGLDIRIDHSLFARFALDGLDPQLVEDFRALGYEPSDFRSQVLDAGTNGRPGCRIFSFLPDSWVAVYKCRRTGALVPFVLNPGAGQLDVTAGPKEEVIGANNSALSTVAVEFLRERFTYVGLLPEPVLKENLRLVIRSVPPTSPIFIILPKEYYGTVDSESTKAAPAIDLNRWSSEMARGCNNVHLIRIDSFVRNSSEIQDNHFHRTVYFRMFEHMQAVLADLHRNTGDRKVVKGDGQADAKAGRLVETM